MFWCYLFVFPIKEKNVLRVLIFFLKRKKYEVFIYRWYIPSASLEVGPWCSAATVEICVSCLQKSFHLLKCLLSEEKAWHVVKFWDSLIGLLFPVERNQSVVESPVNGTIFEQTGTDLLQYWKVIPYSLFVKSVQTTKNIIILKICCVTELWMYIYIYIHLLKLFFSFLICMQNIFKWFIMSYQIILLILICAWLFFSPFTT